MADGYIPSYPEPRRTRALQLSNVAWNALAELAQCCGASPADVVEVWARDTPLSTTLHKETQKLQQLEQLKNDFLSTVSHELRTPMANMTMAIQMLRVTTNEEKRERYLQILASECAREAQLVNDLLDLQRLDMDSRPLKLEAVRVADWLPAIVEPFRLQAEQHDQTLTLQVSPGLLPFTTDSGRLKRILVELLNNACKYTPSSGALCIAVVTMKDRLQVGVSNWGVEIATEEMSRIFEKFYRIPNNDPWQQGGTGLGLALVKKLVEQLQGKISVASHSGQTTFLLELPQLRQPAQRPRTP